MPRVLVFDHRDSSALHRARLGWSEPSQVVVAGHRDITRLPGRQLPPNPFLDYLSGEGEAVADPGGFDFESIVQNWGDYTKVCCVASERCKCLTIDCCCRCGCTLPH